MKLLSAYQQLKKLAPTFLTREAAACLKISAMHATSVLKRLVEQNAIVRLARGRFAYSSDVDPLLLPNILSYPMLAYVSLYSALYYHGIIDQIPSTVYAISNGKTKAFETPLAKISIHSINPVLFSDYDHYGRSALLMATPEKALFDTLYLMPAKSNYFKKLTELDIPDDFNFSLFKKWIKLIKNKSRRVMIENSLKIIK